MIDYELGEIRFDWDDILRVDFHEAPEAADIPYGSLLYGTVRTVRRKQYTGYIQWDMDERNGDDILDGETRYGDQKIPFEKIASIEKINNGKAVDVTFDSGRTITMDGSNDCEDGNRGIGIYAPELGSVEVEWDNFEQVTFETAPLEGIHYSDFTVAQGLQAEISTFDDDLYSGYIAYDMDELWDFELLDGDDDAVKLQIPFRNILSIQPKNRLYSIVNLRDGQSLLLGERQDVSSKNEGIIIRTGDDGEIHVQWDLIDLIKFKH